jgi:hypothetical protein
MVPLIQPERKGMKVGNVVRWYVSANTQGKTVGALSINHSIESDFPAISPYSAEGSRDFMRVGPKTSPRFLPFMRLTSLRLQTLDGDGAKQR